MDHTTVNRIASPARKTGAVFFIFLAHLLFPKFGYAQTASEAQTANGDGADWKLPTLQTLTDSALIHSPAVKLAETNVQMGRYELTDAQRDWLQRLNLSADTRYGSMMDYSRMASIAGGSFIPLSQNIYSLNYGLGFSAYMPLADIFDRKRKIQKANLRVEQFELQKDETERMVKQLVIGAYYDVLSARKTLEIRAEMRASAGTLYEQTKSDFAENRTTFAEHTKAYETYLLAQNEYETQRNNLLKAVRLLEEVVGIEIIKQE